MSRLKGQLSIDPQDVVGQSLGKFDVVSYNGSVYEQTAGGAKLRHYYNCINKDGSERLARRSEVQSEMAKEGYR